MERRGLPLISSVLDVLSSGPWVWMAQSLVSGCAPLNYDQREMISQYRSRTDIGREHRVARRVRTSLNRVAAWQNDSPHVSYLLLAIVCTSA